MRIKQLMKLLKTNNVEIAKERAEYILKNAFHDEYMFQPEVVDVAMEYILLYEQLELDVLV